MPRSRFHHALFAAFVAAITMAASAGVFVPAFQLAVHAATISSGDPCDLGANAARVSFDDRGTGTVIDNQYRSRGVEFSGTAVIDGPSVAAHSGAHAARSVTGDLGSAGHPIEMSFPRPVTALALFVGRESATIGGQAAVRAHLTAFGTDIASGAVVVLTAEADLPAEAVAIDRCLAIAAPPGVTITRATLDYAAYDNASAYDRRWIDDLTLLPVADGAAMAPSGAAPGLAAPPRSAIEPAAGSGDDAWRWQAMLAVFGLVLMLTCFVGWHWQQDARAMRGTSDDADGPRYRSFRR